MPMRSRKPCVASKPTLAPLRSSKVLVATVVPYISSSMLSIGRSARRVASSIADAGSFGVDSVLPTFNSLVSPTSATKSVNVPPASAPALDLLTLFILLVLQCVHRVEQK
ncbi:hypothetical protein OAI29_06340 [Amylibacter sp.]|nr:hypothetical protein [Amylibacter sp.]